MVYFDFEHLCLFRNSSFGFRVFLLEGGSEAVNGKFPVAQNLVFRQLAGGNFKNLFEYIHVYVAQGIMIAVSLVIFFVYINYAQRPKTVST